MLPLFVGLVGGANQQMPWEKKNSASQNLVAANRCQGSEGKYSSVSAKAALIDGKAFNMTIVRVDLRKRCNPSLSPDPKPTPYHLFIRCEKFRSEGCTLNDCRLE